MTTEVSLVVPWTKDAVSKAVYVGAGSGGAISDQMVRFDDDGIRTALATAIKNTDSGGNSHQHHKQCRMKWQLL